MSEMNKSQSEKETSRMIEEALRQLAEEGRIYDTGQRRWSERTQSYQIVWAATPPKQERH
jgi:hypothetical protein